ncbi:DUF881 domain-containing protein [Streptomyces sp. HNM0574]|uniref:DUF881 domain-containing protein n=1 Tax=Streptomyces sp. HNM0574 TaxID=2714954 RepID=UPI00146EEC9D|nr:DUF881 domain-containing protein [Streptomyces sp. HNM0574]NLU69960.1 DUF881 domain-containing protein [Streptomyces sp. HNM0574]
MPQAGSGAPRPIPGNAGVPRGPHPAARGGAVPSGPRGPQGPGGPQGPRGGASGATPEPPDGGKPEQDKEQAHTQAQGDETRSSGRRRLAEALWPPRVSRAQLIVAVLLFVLGLGLAIQVRSTSENSALRGARQEDLVRILDELDDRTKRLEDEKRSLERQRTELDNSSDQAEEARKQTREKQRQLGVLAGTVKAEGPGIALTISDPGGSVEADMLLDTVQELRAAGAEAIEVNEVRVVASTYFSDAGGGISVDGRRITQPYRFEVIGKPQDLEPALNIPGGVVQTLRKEQAEVVVNRSERITVDALRPAKRPQYADPSSS